MKSYFFPVAAGAFAFLLASTATAIQCESSSIDLVVTARAAQAAESNAHDCVLEGEAAIHLAGTLVSSLVRARAYVEIRFLDSQGKQLWADKRGPWLDAFSRHALDETIAVPIDAARVRTVVKIESGSKEAAGEWRISGLTVSPGVLIVGEALEGTVISTAQPAIWRFSTIPPTAQGEFEIELRDPGGRTVAKRHATWNSGKQNEINFGKLPVGYYLARAQFQATSRQGRSGTWTEAIAVLPDGPPPNEPRFGMDAALNLFSKSHDMTVRSADMIRRAGIGTVRERFRWSDIQPARNEPTNWKHVEKVAEIIAKAGMEQVQVFHDFPAWTHPGVQGNGRPPLDHDAVFELGQSFARGPGRTIRSIEYWNEQNAIEFFVGYPFQYANGLKAFSTGVKSVDPNIRVLIGASAGRPGDFFKETYRNGVANFFDVRNQHYYGGGNVFHPDKMDFTDFFDKHVARLERDAGISEKPAWLTERGYSLRRDGNGNLLTAEREQAEFLVKAYADGFAAGYERVFFFFWSEWIEADLHTWGIVRKDLSPRPAYLALSLLTRHLAGASVLADERHGAGRTVYFRQRNGNLVAVSWGGGAPLSRLGPNVLIHDIFGRQLNSTSEEASAVAPLLLSQIDKLPQNAKQVNLPTQAIQEPAPLRLDARLRIDGKNHTYLSGNRIAARVDEGKTLEIVARVYSTGKEAESLTVNCIPGPGLTLISPARSSVRQQKLNGETLSCLFQANLATIGESSAAIQAENNRGSDIARIALIPGAAPGAMGRSLMPGNTCPRWVPRHSANLTLAIEAHTAAGPCAVSMASRINQQGDAWVFPAVQIPANEFVAAIGLRLRISQLPGYPSPPTPLLLQLVEKSGGTWIIRLPQEKDSKMHSALFSLARLAAWSRDDNGQLDLNNVREIMLGWGGHRGRVGQQHGFVIEAIEVLQGNTLK